MDIRSMEGIFIPIRSGEGDLDDHWALAVVVPRDSCLLFVIHSNP